MGKGLKAAIYCAAVFLASFAIFRYDRKKREQA